MIFLDKNSKKKIYQVLHNITGLGHSNTTLICKKFGFQKNCVLKDLDISKFELLKNYLSSNYILDKTLNQKRNNNVKKKIELGTYVGKRHKLGYPVRGQRTLSNGKTQRNLHKFRFHYDSDLFKHRFFANQRKSKKKKKLMKVFQAKTKKSYFQPSFKKVRVISQIKPKKKDANLKYLEKLNKIKAERKAQIEKNFQRDHAKAVKTHPYFLNIQKSNLKKKISKKKG